MRIHVCIYMYKNQTDTLLKYYRQTQIRHIIAKYVWNINTLAFYSDKNTEYLLIILANTCHSYCIYAQKISKILKSNFMLVLNIIVRLKYISSLRLIVKMFRNVTILAFYTGKKIQNICFLS